MVNYAAYLLTSTWRYAAVPRLSSGCLPLTIFWHDGVFRALFWRDQSTGSGKFPGNFTGRSHQKELLTFTPRQTQPRLFVTDAQIQISSACCLHQAGRPCPLSACLYQVGRPYPFSACCLHRERRQTTPVFRHVVLFNSSMQETQLHALHSERWFAVLLLFCQQAGLHMRDFFAHRGTRIEELNFLREGKRMKSSRNAS